MVKIIIPPDSTITTILPHLRKPEEYVRSVFHNFHEFNRDNPSHVVTIGITGAGRNPNYKFVPSNSTKNRDGFTINAFGFSEIYFNGQTHRPVLDVIDVDAWNNWSCKGMTIEQIKELIGVIRAKRSKTGI